MKSIIDAAATDYLNWIGAAIHECDLPATTRVRAAAGCLAIAQDHHHAIVVLLDHNLYASSFALNVVAQGRDAWGASPAALGWAERS